MPLAGFGAVGVAGIAGDEHPRGARTAVLRQDVVEPVRQPVAYLVDAVPGDVADIQGVGVEDVVGLADDLLDGGFPHGALVVGVHFAQVHVHAEQVAAFAGDQQDAAAGSGLDGALGADVREVGDGEDVHDAPGVVGLVAGEVTADGLADLAARTVGAHNVFGADNALLAFVGTGRVDQGDRDGVLALAGDLEAMELVAVVRRHSRGGVGHELGEVVQHAGLVHDQVRELADPGGIIHCPGSADNAGVIGRVRLPERHLGDAVGLGDDPLGEAEGLERLDAAGLDAVGLADGEPARDDAPRCAW